MTRLQFLKQHDSRGLAVRWRHLFAFVILALSADLVADETTTPPTKRQEAPAAVKQEAPEDDNNQKRIATIWTLILVVIAIALVGVILVMGTAAWGHSLRRVLRMELPEQSRGDEFWYLRPEKKLESGESSSSADEDDLSSSQETTEP